MLYREEAKERVVVARRRREVIQPYHQVWGRMLEFRTQTRW